MGVTEEDSDVVESEAIVDGGDSEDVVAEGESCCLISAGTISFVLLKMKCFDSGSNPEGARDLLIWMFKNAGMPLLLLRSFDCCETLIGTVGLWYFNLGIIVRQNFLQLFVSIP